MNVLATEKEREARVTAHGEKGMRPLELLLAKLRARKILPYLNPQDVVCDVGCGFRAEFLRHFKKRFSLGIGLDLSVDSSVNEEGIVLKVTDLNGRFPLEDASVDVVTSLAVLEHLKEPAKHLREIYRVLKPSGKLLITTPTRKNKPFLELLAFRLSLLDEIEIGDHKNYYSGSDLRRMLVDAGFNNAGITTSTWQFGLNNFVHGVK